MREAMLKENPALESIWPQNDLTLKWVGMYAQVLKASAPLHVRRIAGALHNRRQHNASPSGLSDLARKYQQMANANFEIMRAKIRNGVSPNRPTPVKFFILTQEQVWEGYYESAYDPKGAVRAATTQEAYDAVVCFAYFAPLNVPA